MTVKRNICADAFRLFKQRMQAALDAYGMAVTHDESVALDMLICKLLKRAAIIVVAPHADKAPFRKAKLHFFKICLPVSEEENQRAVLFSLKRMRKVHRASVTVGHNKHIQA